MNNKTKIWTRNLNNAFSQNVYWGDMELLTSMSAYLNRIDETIQALNRHKKRSKPVPEGKIRVVGRENGYQYYLRMDSKDTIGSYLREENRNVAHDIVQSAYDKKLLDCLDANHKVIEKAINAIKINNPTNVYNAFSSGRKLLIEPISLSDEEFVAMWKSVSYIGNPVPFDENFFHETKLKERVRSKTEILIANMLTDMGIPYRYEYPVVVKGRGTLYPDFYCLNVRTRKEIIWEHFGMMGDSEYASNTVQKMDYYLQNGFYIGDNFIFTMESNCFSLKISTIEQYIVRYLM